MLGVVGVGADLGDGELEKGDERRGDGPEENEWPKGDGLSEVKGLESECECECECDCEWVKGEARERDERDGEEEGGREERQGEEEGEGEEEDWVGEVFGAVGRLSRARTISYLEARSRYWSLRLRG